MIFKATTLATVVLSSVLCKSDRRSHDRSYYEPLNQDYFIQWDNVPCPSTTSYMNNQPKWTNLNLRDFEDGTRILVHVDTYAQVCSQNDFKADNFGAHERVIIGNLQGDNRNKNNGRQGTDATAEAVFSIKYQDRETEAGPKWGLESLYLSPPFDVYLVLPIESFQTLQPTTSISLSLTASELPFGIQEGSGAIAERHVDKGQIVLKRLSDFQEETGRYTPGASWAAPNSSYDWAGRNTYTSLADTSHLTTIDEVKSRELETIIFNSSQKVLAFKITNAVERAKEEERDLTIGVGLTNPHEYRNTGKPCGFIVIPSTEAPAITPPAYLEVAISRPATKTFIKEPNSNQTWQH